MLELAEKVEQLYSEELEKLKKNRSFSSSYEAYSNLLEGVQNSYQAFSVVDSHLDRFWDDIKMGAPLEFSDIRKMGAYSLVVAHSMIQVAALAQKTVEDLEDNENK